MDEARLLDWFREHLFLEFGIRKDYVVPAADLLADLGLDSLDEMNLMFDIEEGFDLEIFMDSDTELPNYEQIRTVGDAIQFLRCRLKDGPSASDSFSSP